jgi:hypothetical protein
MRLEKIVLIEPPRGPAAEGAYWLTQELAASVVVLEARHL